MSCERNRTAACSLDIHLRIVYQVIGLGKAHKDVAEHLNVNPSNVITRFEQTGDVSKNKYPPNISVTKLSDIGKYYILDLVIEKPGIHLREI